MEATKNIFRGALVLAILGGILFILESTAKPIPDEIIVASTNSDAEIKSVTIGGQEVKVDLALTPLSQGEGLSRREKLKENEGMLFVFAKTGRYYFWMKEMKFTIDIIWFDEGKRIVYMKKDARPDSYPDLFGSDVEAKYVLEVNSGFADKNNLKVGDLVEFRY